MRSAETSRAALLDQHPAAPCRRQQEVRARFRSLEGWRWKDVGEAEFERQCYDDINVVHTAGMPQFWPQQPPGMGSAAPEHLMQARQMQMDPAMVQFYMQQQQQQLAAAQHQAASTAIPPSTPGGPQEQPPQPDLHQSDTKPE